MGSQFTGQNCRVSFLSFQQKSHVKWWAQVCFISDGLRSCQVLTLLFFLSTSELRFGWHLKCLGKRLLTVCKLTFSAHNVPIWWLIFKHCYVINGHTLYYHFTPASKKYIPPRLFQYFWVIAGKGWMNKFVNIDQSWHSCYPSEAFCVGFLHPAVFKASHVFSWLVIRGSDVHFRFIFWFTMYGNFLIWTLPN